MPFAMKGYFEVTVHSPAESREAIVNRLAELGSPGFFETKGDIIAYFDEDLDIRRICDELAGFRDVLMASGLDPSFTFDYEQMSGQDWNGLWKKNFTAIDVGDNFTVTPSWGTVYSDRLVITIDPGMAFGTGHHETTRTCLILMERFSRNIVKGDFLDIGTGTGILAIAASKLGFQRVTAVDTDIPAIETARRNTVVNGVHNITLRRGSVSAVVGSFDCITANLFSELLVRIAGEIGQRLKPRGVAILSGMLSGQEREVIREMEKAGHGLTYKLSEGEWVTLVFFS
jgi:ribosomal protein L11 methyltransferase